MLKEIQTANIILFAVKQNMPTWSLQIAFFTFQSDAATFAEAMQERFPHLDFEVVEVVK